MPETVVRSRYIVSRRRRDTANAPEVHEIVSALPDVQVVRSNADYAVVYLSGSAEERLRRKHPELLIEKDFQHRLIASAG